MNARKPPASRNAAQAGLDPRRVAQRLASRAAGAQRRSELVRRPRTQRRSASTSASETAATASREVADAVAVDRDAQPDLRLDLVALGDRDLAHVVAEAGDLERLRLVPARGRARPDARYALATSGSRQWPTTVFRRRRIRVSMNPNSRSPCADWFRFMKSMSISAHGRSRLNCVWRWSSGFCSALSPAIHIFAGEKVCIHAITPMHVSAAFASSATRRIEPGLVATSLCTTRTGIVRLRVETGGDLARVRLDLPQRRSARTSPGSR